MTLEEKSLIGKKNLLTFICNAYVALFVYNVRMSFPNQRAFEREIQLLILLLFAFQPSNNKKKRFCLILIAFLGPRQTYMIELF